MDLENRLDDLLGQGSLTPQEHTALMRAVLIQQRPAPAPRLPLRVTLRVFLLGTIAGLGIAYLVWDVWFGR